MIKLKNINNFINNNWPWPETFKSQLEYYQYLNKNLNYLTKEKESYEEYINKYSNNDKDITIKDILNLYYILNNLTKENNPACSKYDLELLKRKILSSSSDLHNYIRIIENITRTSIEINNILSQNITFYNFHNTKDCHNKPYLLKKDDELICIHCGANTKEYNINKEELEFLILSAKHQKILLKEESKISIKK